MKVYFNTHAFDEFIKTSPKIETTSNPAEAVLLVLGAKKADYSAFTNLKAVFRFGIGSENVDFEYLKARSIPAYFPDQEAKEILYDSTANFTVYGILTLLYQGAFGDVGTWKKKERDYIGKKTALVIGLGNIGKRVAKKLKPLMKVATYDTLYNKESELRGLIEAADVITLHLPLTKETANFFDKEKLSWVKNDAILVNTARGALFDEQALYEKLVNTNCRAFFDVFWEEPYQGKLKELGQSKFFMTPHSASSTKEFTLRGFQKIISIINQLEK